MARCELTGKGPVVGNLVSHSNIKTKTVLQPNVQYKRVFSSALNRMVRLKLAVSTLKDMEHCGSFDKFILRQTSSKLSPRALVLKSRILAKLKPKKA